MSCFDHVGLGHDVVVQQVDGVTFDREDSSYLGRSEQYSFRPLRLRPFANRALMTDVKLAATDGENGQSSGAKRRTIALPTTPRCPATNTRFPARK
jgi:hypothetical protein